MIERPTGRPDRRTFAIISHPDAGKTTLTEKLLLFGGAIHLAGEVDGAAEQQKLFGQRRLSRIRMRDDCKGAPVGAAGRAFDHDVRVRNSFRGFR